jgi:hypothetical protein
VRHIPTVGVTANAAPAPPCDGAIGTIVSVPLTVNDHRRLRASTTASGQSGAMTEAFDLNSAEVLEHWPTAFAVREVIANALDEQIITETQAPDILRLGSRRWAVRDYGRGIHYSHLTQAESAEKLAHPGVIGTFGFGLNDALAVLDRTGIAVTIRSRHGTITTRQQAKAGFPDVTTLHGVVAPPDDPTMAARRSCSMVWTTTTSRRPRRSSFGTAANGARRSPRC